MLVFNEVDHSWSKYVYYDPTSCSGLRWKVEILSGKNRKMTAVGGVAGSLCKTNGYWNVTVNKVTRRVHRVVLALHGIELPSDMDVDHEDGDKANNLFGNLRIVNRPVNSKNRRKRSDNTTSVTGVQWHFTSKTNVTSAVARWTTNAGKRLSKYFSVEKLGLLPAFKEAVAHRRLMLESPNCSEYTKRHGT